MMPQAASRLQWVESGPTRIARAGKPHARQAPTSFAERRPRKLAPVACAQYSALG